MYDNMTTLTIVIKLKFAYYRCAARKSRRAAAVRQHQRRPSATPSKPVEG